MATTFESSTARGTREPLGGLWARVYTLNWEAIAWVLIFALALFTRFHNLGERVMSHDESLHTRYSYNLYHEGNFQHTPLMHGPILFHMTALNYFLFGDNDFTARIYTAVLGVLMVMFPLLFRRWLGRAGALVASVMLLISPLVMYYNRYIREDTPSIFFTLVMVYCVMMYLNGPLRLRRRARWLYIFSGAMLASLGSKESGFIYIAILGSFLTLYWVVRLIQHYRRVPGKPLMHFLSLGVLLGGVAALGMYVVLSIIPPSLLASAGLDSLEGTSFVGWTVVIITLVIGALIGTAIWAFRGSRVPFHASDLLVILLVALIACAGMIAAEEMSRVEPGAASETAEVADPDAEGALLGNVASSTPIIAAWALAAVVVAGVIIGARRGLFRALYRFPEFDVLVIMGTLILPWLTAIIIALTGASPVDYSTTGITRAVLSLLPLAAISIAVGLAWNWKRWLIAATVFHVLFAFFFTTMFTNVNGLATGMVGSLGYWIEQQGVRRGNQPQYYYLLVIMPFYEFLPIIGSVLAMLAGLTRFWRGRRLRLEARTLNEARVFAELDAARAKPLAVVTAAEAEDEAEAEAISAPPGTRWNGYLRRVPFLLLVSWWAVLNAIAYTLAGEKMPWLGMHITVPMILLAGWYFGGLFESVNWTTFFRRGWVFLPLWLLLLVVLFQVAQPFLLGQSPFGGLTQQEQQALFQWLAFVGLALLVGFLIFRLARTTGGRQLRKTLGISVFLLLAVLTFRSAWMAAFVNYDLPTEFLVYAHSATAVKTVLHDLEDLSQRITGGRDLRFAYDNETSWPNSWYYRDFPNAVYVGANPTPQQLNDALAVVVGEANRSKVEPILEDRYFHFEYIRMWWPMQDYFGLTAQRIANTFDFSPSNTQAAELRRGLFDIWWSRDYDRYSKAVGGNWKLTSWPVSDRMHYYVRKDVAAQIWNLGAGEGTALATTQETKPNRCVANWYPRTAELVFATGGDDLLRLNHPLDIAVSAGRVYVADEFNNRVVVYGSDGAFITAIGGMDEETGSALFNRPNGVAIGPDGNLYVADTWNYRIVVLTPDGEVVTSWGQPGQFGIEAAPAPFDAFWGPRDVAVDAEGRVYVSDTGNKRVRVYTARGEYIRDIGSGGSAEGQLDEPAGLVLHLDGRLFVADTWNRRISVFNTDDGALMYTFPVRGWYDDRGNRPYLALDMERNLLYVGDPEAGRVLIYDTLGNCVGSFGQAGIELPAANQLNVVGGITTDPGGNLYASDAQVGRVLRYGPYPVPALPENANDLSALEVTGEVSAEATDAVALETVESVSSVGDRDESELDALDELTQEAQG